jgi:hypothetical protein
MVEQPLPAHAKLCTMELISSIENGITNIYKVVQI